MAEYFRLLFSVADANSAPPLQRFFRAVASLLSLYGIDFTRGPRAFVYVEKVDEKVELFGYSFQSFSGEPTAVGKLNCSSKSLFFF